MEAKKTETINLEENKIYIVKNQELVPVDPPPDGFGNQTFVWINGEVDRIDISYLKKIKTNKKVAE